MHRPKLSMIVALTLLATTITWAQSFFSSAPTPAPTPPANNGPTVLSPSEFKKQVTERNQQTQEDINKQVNKIISKMGPSAPLPTPPPPAVNSTPTDTPAAVSTNTAEPQNTPPASTPSQVQATPQPQPLPAPSTDGTASTQIPIPAPAQSQPYTGFIGGNNNAGTAPAGNGTKETSTTGGGWNIKY